MIPERKLCFFIFERFGHVFRRKSFVEFLVRSVHILVKTRLARFFLGNLKETERRFWGLPATCLWAGAGGRGGDRRARLVILCCVGGQPPRLKSADLQPCAFWNLQTLVQALRLRIVAAVGSPPPRTRAELQSRGVPGRRFLFVQSLACSLEFQVLWIFAGKPEV